MPSEIGLIGATGGFIFFTGLAYALFVPALIYKVIADGVAKGLELHSVVDGEVQEGVSEEEDSSDKGLDPGGVELQDYHSSGTFYGDNSDSNEAENGVEQLEEQRIKPLYVLGGLLLGAIIIQILVSI